MKSNELEDLLVMFREMVNFCVLENLKGIREGINKRKLKLNKYNGKIQPHRTKPKKLLRRLNNWNYRKLQNFIEYKAKWNCLPVSYLDAYRTSSICPICGLGVEPNGHRFLKCGECELEIDRDVLACLNLLKMKGVWFSTDMLLMMSNNDEGKSKVVKFGWIIYLTKLNLPEPKKPW